MHKNGNSNKKLRIFLYIFCSWSIIFFLSYLIISFYVISFVIVVWVIILKILYVNILLFYLFVCYNVCYKLYV
jgi:hypothetical protein